MDIIIQYGKDSYEGDLKSNCLHVNIALNKRVRIMTVADLLDYDSVYGSEHPNLPHCLMSIHYDTAV